MKIFKCTSGREHHDARYRHPYSHVDEIHKYNQPQERQQTDVRPCTLGESAHTEEDAAQTQHFEEQAKENERKRGIADEVKRNASIENGAEADKKKGAKGEKLLWYCEKAKKKKE